MSHTTSQIYVQIPAYRDTELTSTLEQLFSKASKPGRIRVGLAWQHSAEEKLPDKYNRKTNIEVIDILHTESKGCNWARSLLQKKWEGEKYTLFLDSHHRFVTGWDDKVIEMYENLKTQGIKKPLITAYLPSYNSLIDPRDRMRSLLKIYFLKRSNGLLTHITGKHVTCWKWLTKPIPAHFVSLHFLFTEGKFNEEIPFDPGVYFFGDEISIGLRAFTCGYDLYHPHIILGWHEYKRVTRIPHWDDHRDWWRQNEKSFNKLKTIFTGTYKGKFGTGNLRTIKEYENYIGRSLYSNGSIKNE